MNKIVIELGYNPSDRTIVEAVFIDLGIPPKTYGVILDLELRVSLQDVVITEEDNMTKMSYTELTSKEFSTLADSIKELNRMNVLDDKNDIELFNLNDSGLEYQVYPKVDKSTGTYYMESNSNLTPITSDDIMLRGCNLIDLNNVFVPYDNRFVSTKNIGMGRVRYSMPKDLDVELVVRYTRMVRKLFRGPRSMNNNPSSFNVDDGDFGNIRTIGTAPGQAY